MAIRPILPADYRSLACPKCGGVLKYGEFVFSSRSLQGWAPDGTLFVGSDYEDSLDTSDDSHIYCLSCIAEWQLPANVSFDRYSDDDNVPSDN